MDGLDTFFERLSATRSTGVPFIGLTGSGRLDLRINPSVCNTKMPLGPNIFGQDCTFSITIKCQFTPFKPASFRTLGRMISA
jgi:hypothetical protein